MSIRLKFIINAIVAIVCVLVMGATGFYFTSSVATVSLSLFEKEARPILRIMEVEKTSQSILLNLFTHISAIDEEMMKSLDTEILELQDLLRQHLKKYEDLVLQKESPISHEGQATGQESEGRGDSHEGEGSGDHNRVHLEEYKRVWEKFSQKAKEILEISSAYQKEEALEMLIQEGNGLYNDAVSILHQQIAEHRDRMESLRNEADTDQQAAIWSTIFLTGLAILVAAFSGYMVARSIVRPIQKFADNLTQGADLASQSVSSLSQASQVLAESSSSQASSIEQTSAALEEFASMTKNNAENAIRSHDLAKNTSGEMVRLSNSMGAIRESSDRISGITKTIDGIAFQTNILSLNAAVEAARAGEAGMGFAVVASEVRNLAMKSAEAAQDIAERIEDNVVKAEAGVAISKKTSVAFENINQRIEEISNASQEQSQGLGQINQAITLMDNATQRNASMSIDNSNAVEQLGGITQNIREVVHKLENLIHGGNSNGVSPTSTEPRPHIEQPPPRRINDSEKANLLQAANDF